MLRALVGLLFQKFCFFMDCPRTPKATKQLCFHNDLGTKGPMRNRFNFSPARIVCFGGKLSAYILCHQKLKVYLGIEFWEGKLMDVMEIKNILEFDEILKSF